MRKKEMLVIVVLVISFVILAGCSTPVQKELKKCSKLNDAKEKDSCYEILAVNNTDINLCSGILDSLNRNLCQREIALAKRDISMCESMQDRNQKDLCFRNIAISLNDSKTCDKVEGQLQKSLCLSELGVYTEKTCQGMRDQIKEASRCFYKAASQSKDIKLCDEIAVQVIQDNCYRNMYNTEKFDCEFPPSDEKEKCYARLGRATGDMQICSNLKGEDSDLCFSSAARIKRDAALCKSVQDSQKKDMCYYLLAVNSHVNACREILNSNLSNDCVKYAELYIKQ